VHNQILAANRTPIAWEEMLLQWNVTLDKRTVVQVWQSAANAKLTTGKGYQVPPSRTRLIRPSLAPMISGILTVEGDSGWTLARNNTTNFIRSWITAILSKIGG